MLHYLHYRFYLYYILFRLYYLHHILLQNLHFITLNYPTLFMLHYVMNVMYYLHSFTLFVSCHLCKVTLQYKIVNAMSHLGYIKYFYTEEKTNYFILNVYIRQTN